MANQSKNKKNQPPTGEGKKQSPESGKAGELRKRSEVLQAQRNPEANFGSEDEEPANLPDDARAANPKRPKAGR